jgi:CPA2 family monovalent cation:H+ antiporter-2
MDPLKNLFGAVFFVSVGMMIEPNILIEYSVPIIIITAVVLVGNVLFSTFGIVLSGEALKVALQSGLSLAQIGEFSFIIATLGMQLGVISPFLYPIIVSVSVITSFVTPFLMKATNPIYEQIESRIPSKWSKIITGYSNNKINKASEDNEWKRYFKSTSSSIAVYTLLSVAILVISKLFLNDLITEYIDSIWGNIIHSGITIIVMSPFMNAMMRAGYNNKSDAKEKWSVLSSSYRFGIICLFVVKHLIPLAMIISILLPIFPDNIPILCIISLFIAIVIKLITGFRHQTKKMEKRFKDNLSDKSVDNKTFTKEVKEELKKKSIHIERIEVPPNYSNIGKTLGELNFRNRTGISIVSIIRGNKIINIPDRHTQLFPFDKVVIVGSDEEVQNFMIMLEKSHIEEDTEVDIYKYRVELYQYELEVGNQIIGRTIRSLDMQKQTGCLITGIERKGIMIVKFSADFEFKQHDILWIAGEKQKILNFETAIFNTNNIKQFTY